MGYSEHGFKGKVESDKSNEVKKDVDLSTSKEDYIDAETLAQALCAETKHCLCEGIKYIFSYFLHREVDRQVDKDKKCKSTEGHDMGAKKLVWEKIKY